MTAQESPETGSVRSDANEANLFIAWGGEWSRQVARALYDWLPSMIDAARPWMSEESLRTGSEWFSQVKRQLARVDAAIVCLTPDNLMNHWIHFETGAIANRGLPQSGVMLYLIGVEPKDVVPPLSLFQGQIAAEKSKTFKLLKDINLAIRANVPEERLKQRFEHGWKSLDDSLQTAKPTGNDQRKETRSAESMFEEILGLVRSVGAGVSRAIENSDHALMFSRGLLPAYPTLSGSSMTPPGVTGMQGPTGIGPMAALFGGDSAGRTKVGSDTESSAQAERRRLADIIKDIAGKSEADKE